MESNRYRITIRLNSSVGKVVSLESRQPDGSLVSSSVVLEKGMDVKEEVVSLMEGARRYDPSAHRRAHDLALAAARSQAGE